MELDSSSVSARQLYADMGVSPVINAVGNMTMLGGSSPSPTVLEAMALANRYFVDMDELLRTSGLLVADMLECEAAMVTSGCSAALLLGTAACMTGADPDKMSRLPDTTGMKRDVLIQSGHRYKYERVVRMAGARLVEVGSDRGTTPQQLDEALSPEALAVLCPETGILDGVLPVEEVIDIAHSHGVPVIVDAAYQVYPLEGLKRYTARGADLVGYGAKYFGAPNSSGLLCGRRDLVEAARLHAFASFEKNGLPGFGRPLKIDRQEVIGVVVALREWLALDHQTRHEAASRRGHRLRQALHDLPHIALSPSDPGAPATTISVTVDVAALGQDAEAVASALRAGDPSIWTSAQGSRLALSMYTVVDGDELVIAERLAQVLSV